MELNTFGESSASRKNNNFWKFSNSFFVINIFSIIRLNRDMKKMFTLGIIRPCGDHTGRAANGVMPVVNRLSRALIV